MKLLAKAWENLPYFAAAVALASGIYAYYALQYALEDTFELRPLMLASETWPTARGRIVEHHVRETVAGRFSHMPVTHYTAAPVFVFTHAGHEYRSSRICLQGGNCGRGTRSEEAALALLREYPVGLEVTVYHDPQLTPAMAEADERPWAVLRAGYRPWIENAIRRHWLQALVAGSLALLLTVFAIMRSKEFRSEKSDTD